MVITFAKLGQYGRLGNCQFQMAATIGLALKHQVDYRFPHWQYSGDFKVPINKYGALRAGWTYEEPSFSYREVPYRPGMNLHGYFQSYKYWLGYEDQIKNLLSSRYVFPLNPGVCSIHVRRGDYLQFPDCHTNLGMDYYRLAMKIMNCCYYWVFSDDLAWCKEHFKGPQFKFIDEMNAPKAQAKMSSCGHHIIANSSFSWWGAYLNGYNNKRVIAPKKWFGPKLAASHRTDDLFLPDWKVI